MWSADLRAEKKRASGSSSSRWLREDGPSKVAPPQKETPLLTKTVTATNDLQSMPSIILNKSGTKVTLAELMTKPQLLFPNQLSHTPCVTPEMPVKEIPKVAINSEENLEEEISCALNKRFRDNEGKSVATKNHDLRGAALVIKNSDLEKTTHDGTLHSVSHDDHTTPSTCAPMEGVQSDNTAAEKALHDSVQHFLSAEPGSQACRAK
ncbi:hypothetical protein A2U01_0006205 [Trifolium medium]|uniref:Uncharacterized protein n=1 Tax=Trifolium medium TaxID=97028 RepID=A0A392MDI9_9FABA|nr:hypothetical protein [Trifolium medium]